MDYADFVHLARTSEQACAKNAKAYRRSVMLFAALGYLWVVGCLLLSVAALVWSVQHLVSGQTRWASVLVLLGAFGLLWASLKALWVNLEPAQGVRIEPDDAPALFEALEKIRKRIQGPPIHEVYLNEEFNASVRQVPRWGVFGGAVNQLVIGLPMLMALDKRRLLAVLAHEYGHLRGGHGRFSAWIYRTRTSWGRLYESMEDTSGPVAYVTQSFLRWYSPRFVARTFAMARQDEFEADRVAAKLLGRRETAESLVESEIKGHWLDQEFWRQHWTQAAHEPLPQGPYQGMRRLLLMPVSSGFALQSLDRAVRRVSNVDDTHPGLRERVKALTGQRPMLPETWSERGALSLLGRHADHWMAQFDRQWCKANADEWKRQHERLARAQARMQALQSSSARSTSELAEMGMLAQRLWPADDAGRAHALFQEVLQRELVHPQALIGLVQSTAHTDPQRCLQYLERLWTHHPTHRHWASSVVLEELETQLVGDEDGLAALKQWRERHRQDEKNEHDASMELLRSRPLEGTLAHDLSDFELDELRAELARMLPVRKAWVVRRMLNTIADRRAHVILLDTSRGDDETRSQLCSELEQRLDLPTMLLVLPMEAVGSSSHFALQPVYERHAT